MTPRRANTRGLAHVRAAFAGILASAALVAGASTAVAGDLESDLAVACRTEFAAHCAGVTPGTPDALACLQRNAPSVSAACRTQLARLPTDDEKATLRSSCRGDYIANCLGVSPGTLDSLRCLQKVGPRLGPACRSAVAAATH